VEYFFGNVNHLLLAFIVGVISLFVKYISDIAKSIQAMSLSVQELNIRMGQITDILKDHEFRIREIEHTKGVKK
jgi:hypothetical protein